MSLETRKELVKLALKHGISTVNMTTAQIEQAIKSKLTMKPVTSAQAEIELQDIPAVETPTEASTIEEEAYPRKATKLTSEQVKAKELLDLIKSIQPESAQIDESAVIKIVKDELSKTQRPREIAVKAAGSSEFKNIGRQHYKFELLLKTISAGVPVFLVGEAGSGKTTAAENAFKAIGLEVELTVFSNKSSESKLFGFIDAAGNYHSTSFSRAIVNGAGWIGDEFDNSGANGAVVINSALANGICELPTGMIKRHENFKAVACANTFGTGASQQYVGRNTLDAATLDRFAFITWDIDRSLEAALIGLNIPAAEFDIAQGGIPNIKNWLKIVQKARENGQKNGIRHIVSPRATIYGAKMIEQGIGLDHLKETLIFKGLNEDQRGKLAI